MSNTPDNSEAIVAQVRDMVRQLYRQWPDDRDKVAAALISFGNLASMANGVERAAHLEMVSANWETHEIARAQRAFGDRWFQSAAPVRA